LIRINTINVLKKLSVKYVSNSLYSDHKTNAKGLNISLPQSREKNSRVSSKMKAREVILSGILIAVLVAVYYFCSGSKENFGAILSRDLTNRGNNAIPGGILFFRREDTINKLSSESNIGDVVDLGRLGAGVQGAISPEQLYQNWSGPLTDRNPSSLTTAQLEYLVALESSNASPGLVDNNRAAMMLPTL